MEKRKNMNPSEQNPLGLTSVWLSTIAVLICLAAVIVIHFLQANKVPDKDYRSDDPSVLVDKAHNGLTFIGQLILFVAGGLIGGTLSLVGLILGLFALRREHRRAAILGIVLSFVGPGILTVFLIATGVIFAN